MTSKLLNQEYNQPNGTLDNTLPMPINYHAQINLKSNNFDLSLEQKVDILDLFWQQNLIKNQFLLI
ncbi:hypothetical protein [Anabaena azotica]|uniref:Uncharacterized protein n=1 Tax=Anabaena azotica FACHB-119 TaxID=947527 RepID=A0ABR8D270_9NOST|nr:hypothetical protein [Anabaena azotica]MBD2500422.1 hypothetical protein [Anabaena azotica FACHB-119]